MLQYNNTVKSYAYTLPLSCVADKNDKGNFFVYKVGTPSKLDPKYLKTAESWFNRLNAGGGSIKVDETQDAEVASSGSMV